GMEGCGNGVVAWAEVKPEHRVLDVGCGTGSLVTQLKRQHPDIDVVGLDPDPKALVRARRKAQSAAVSIQFDQGFSYSLGYPSGSFDRVFSSFMFHHLHEEDREKTLGEIYRVLKPGGRLLLLDFEVQESGKHHVLSTLLHKHASLNENSERRILGLMTDAGFTNAKKLEARTVLMGLGQAGYYQASVPNSGRS